MGLAAAGVYLQHVPVLRKVSRVRLAAELGMSDDQIQRMEQGRNAMLGPALLRLIRLLDASFVEVAELLEGEDSPAVREAAVARARACVARSTALLHRDPTFAEVTDELLELALRRTNGDMTAARRLLLRALDYSFE